MALTLPDKNDTVIVPNVIIHVAYCEYISGYVIDMVASLELPPYKTTTR
jgi:hypothetical protein